MSYYFNSGVGAYIYKKTLNRALILSLFKFLCLFFEGNKTKQSSDYKFPSNMFVLLLFVLLMLSSNTAYFYSCFGKWKNKRQRCNSSKGNGFNFIFLTRVECLKQKTADSPQVYSLFLKPWETRFILFCLLRWINSCHKLLARPSSGKQRVKILWEMVWLKSQHTEIHPPNGRLLL